MVINHLLNGMILQAGNDHIFPSWEKENHLQNIIFGGYVIVPLEAIPQGKHGGFSSQRR